MNEGRTHVTKPRTSRTNASHLACGAVAWKGTNGRYGSLSLSLSDCPPSSILPSLVGGPLLFLCWWSPFLSHWWPHPIPPPRHISTEFVKVGGCSSAARSRRRKMNTPRQTQFDISVLASPASSSCRTKLTRSHTLSKQLLQELAEEALPELRSSVAQSS